MKYIYYTIGILVLLTVFMAVKFTNFKVEVSKPAIVINDRVISEKELDGLLKSSTYSNHTTGPIDAVITNELLIQEAISQGINKEESFRASVENFYEQSLIKSLIDRKFNSIKPQINEKMVDQYLALSGKDIVYSKMIYQTLEDIEKGNIKKLETMTHNFDNLSGELKYILVMMDEKRISFPVNINTELVCYRLDSVKTDSLLHVAPDVEEIKSFLIHQQKGALFAKWMDDLNKNAHIQILTEQNVKKKKEK